MTPMPSVRDIEALGERAAKPVLIAFEMLARAEMLASIARIYRRRGDDREVKGALDNLAKEAMKVAKNAVDMAMERYERESERSMDALVGGQ